MSSTKKSAAALAVEAFKALMDHGVKPAHAERKLIQQIDLFSAADYDHGTLVRGVLDTTPHTRAEKGPSPAAMQYVKETTPADTDILEEARSRGTMRAST